MATKTKPTNRVFTNGDDGEHAAPKTTKRTEAVETLSIAPPKIHVLKLKIRGNAPLVMNKFSQKARQQIRDKQASGSVANKGKKRDAKDFDLAYEQAKHISLEGWCGIPAAAFRAAMISACRLIGFKMTIAKMSVFIIADGFDADDGTPLVKITKGKPRKVEHCVRNATGVVDLRARPMWDEWEAEVTLKYDGDQFTGNDVTNLLSRVGLQVGLCEGRPDSKASCGQGWGTFDVVQG